MQQSHEFAFESDARKSAPSSHSVPERFEPLLDSQEAAVLLRIHPKTLTRMARERRIIGVKVGKAWMFRVSELNRFLESKLASQQLQETISWNSTSRAGSATLKTPSVPFKRGETNV